MNKTKKSLADNPEITEKLKIFFKNQLLNSMEGNKDIPPSFKEMIKERGVSYEMLENYLITTPRLICDFMDSKDIFIEIVRIEGKFSFYINEHFRGSDHDSRKEAETASVIASIEHYKNTFNQNSEEK